MKINVIKPGHALPLGENEVDEGLGNYLIRVKVAEGFEHKEVEDETEPDEGEDEHEDEHEETENIEEMGVREAKPSKRGRKPKNKS